MFPESGPRIFASVVQPCGPNSLHLTHLSPHLCFANTHIFMAPRNCTLCSNARAIVKRPKTGQQICKNCFFYVFETEVHNTITEAGLFKRGDRVAIGASGGKGAPLEYHMIRLIFEKQIDLCVRIDSTVLAYVMKTLNDRYDYGLELFLLSIDEGITGYRDDSLEVRTNLDSSCFATYATCLTLRKDGQTEPAAIRHAAQDSFL